MAAVFSRRIRGFRLVDVAALVLLLALALAVYGFKTIAGAQSADSAGIERQIVVEKKRVRLLQAEVAHLEDPARIERLSRDYLNMGPVAPSQEIALGDLPKIAAGAGKPHP
ncbi:MAG TPA: cell division protein [Caulobacteraceae bacterium]|nr:cell division protein [Caulobacteraceae bacterium]